MQLLTRRAKRRAITASASRLSTGKDSEYLKRLAQPWQMRALDLCDKVGELSFSSKFYARHLARVRIYPATVNQDGTTSPITTGLPVDLLNRVQDAGGGRSRLQYDYGRLMFITGEGVLFCSDEGTEDERWRFLWREELKLNADGTAVRLDVNRRETTERGKAWRMWTSSPRHSDQADSPMRAILDIAEELLILTASVHSTATTRLTNGILALASELSPDPLDAGADEDPSENIFLKSITDHLQAQIDNPGSAAAKVPFILEGGFDYLQDGVKWIQLHDPATDYLERDLRLEAVKRLAISLDFPPEALQGMTDANHWTGQLVAQEMWRSHGVVIAEQWADDICQAYLRPALQDAGYADWDQVVVAFDDSKVVVNPDRSADADAALDRMAIGFPAYRKLKGMDESMKPTEEEQKLLALVKIRDTAGLEESLGIQNLRGPQQQPPVSSNGQPGTPPAPTNGRVTSREEARVASIVGAAHLALRQCRARAGTKIRTQIAKKCPDCQERTAKVEQSLVAAALGSEQIVDLGLDARTLVAGGTREFHDVLCEWGIRAEDATQLCQRVEFYAARSLFERSAPELPPGFVAQVEQAQEVSDAVVHSHS